MNFSKLVTDLWLIGRRRRIRPRILFKAKLARPHESTKASVRPKQQTAREKRVDLVLGILAKAHAEAEQGRISREQLAELRRRADRTIQNA